MDEWNELREEIARAISERIIEQCPSDYTVKVIMAAIKSYMESKAVELDRKNPLLATNKTYDGNSLESAGRHYGIAAAEWSEIIRYEDGFRAALDQAAQIIRGETRTTSLE